MKSIAGKIQTICESLFAYKVVKNQPNLISGILIWWGHNNITFLWDSFSVDQKLQYFL